MSMVSSMTAKLEQLQEDVSSMKEDQKSMKEDQKSMKEDQKSMKEDQKSMKEDQKKLNGKLYLFKPSIIQTVNKHGSFLLQNSIFVLVSRLFSQRCKYSLKNLLPFLFR